MSKDNGRCRFTVELAWDGTSIPPNCDGIVSRISWNNTGARTYYAHLPSTKLGPVVYRIDPGSVGEVADRQVLHAAGLDTRSDIESGLDLNEMLPVAGERQLN